jgi:hypothetical protein
MNKKQVKLHLYVYYICMCICTYVLHMYNLLFYIIHFKCDSFNSGSVVEDIQKHIYIEHNIQTFLNTYPPTYTIQIQFLYIRCNTCIMLHNVHIYFATQYNLYM